MFHLFHLGWFVRLASGAINPNSKNKTEVQWLQHLGWYSHWNIPSTSGVHSLEWTLNILFDINLVNAFIAWLIHVNVLYWTFIHVTCTLHVLHVLDDSGFGYEQPSELSSERHDQLTDQHSELTFWTSELVHEFNVLWFLVSWYDLNLVPVLVKHLRTHKYKELSKSTNPLITIDVFNDFLI